jgi:hypothetical protein
MQGVTLKSRAAAFACAAGALVFTLSLVLRTVYLWLDHGMIKCCNLTK